MKLPATVRVGFADFTVECWPSGHALASQRMGECDKINHIIRVADGMNQRATAHTLLHEVLHACWDMAGLEAGDNEEKIVTCFAVTLSQVWRDNPYFIQFLNVNLGD